MSERTTENVEIEESEETKNVLVVDPDNYQRTKKLELIHDSKKQVLELRRDREEAIGYLGDNFEGRGLDTYKMKLAQTVAQYGSELLPLIEEGKEKGVLNEDDMKVSIGPNGPGADIIQFVKIDGKIPSENEWEHPSEELCMCVYRQFQRIERKLGLGLNLEKDKGPANI